MLCHHCTLLASISTVLRPWTDLIVLHHIVSTLIIGLNGENGRKTGTGKKFHNAQFKQEICPHEAWTSSPTTFNASIYRIKAGSKCCKDTGFWFDTIYFFHNTARIFLDSDIVVFFSFVAWRPTIILISNNRPSSVTFVANTTAYRTKCFVGTRTRTQPRSCRDDQEFGQFIRPPL